jgi:hypothetical protein
MYISHHQFAFEAMNSIIDKFEQQSESSLNMTRRSKKYSDKKCTNSRKERKTTDYWKKEAQRQRRKQGKTRFDTFRREEQPSQEDIVLENIHFANFLSLSESKLARYNGYPYDECGAVIPTNINMCDLFVSKESLGSTDQVNKHLAQSQSQTPVKSNEEDEEDDEDEDEEEDWIYEGRAVYNFDLLYIPELKMLTNGRGWIVKRRHEEEPEVPRKRAKL